MLLPHHDAFCDWDDAMDSEEPEITRFILPAQRPCAWGAPQQRGGPVAAAAGAAAPAAPGPHKGAGATGTSQLLPAFGGKQVPAFRSLSVSLPCDAAATGSIPLCSGGASSGAPGGSTARCLLGDGGSCRAQVAAWLDEREAECGAVHEAARGVAGDGGARALLPSTQHLLPLPAFQLLGLL